MQFCMVQRWLRRQLVPNQKSVVIVCLSKCPLAIRQPPRVVFLVKYNSANNKISQTTI